MISANCYKYIFIPKMPKPYIPPKTTRTLFVIYKLGGKSGTSNNLHHYKKLFPNDYMHMKLLIANLDFLHNNKFVKKLHNSYKGKYVFDNPQTYELTSNAIYQLKKWKMI